ncbi:hypothetical protein LTR66_009051 [Elasticomyces elasticus]|nr:hypothetical protein LTR66_009051 [Elasticomyces elasticus]
MQPTLLRRAGYGTQFEGHHGMQPWAVRPDYKTYQSPYGPNGITASGFGAAAGIFALFFFSDVPKVRKDIMVKLPVVGEHFVKEIPPEDNPF